MLKRSLVPLAIACVRAVFVGFAVPQACGAVRESATPYGIAAHISDSESDRLVETLAALETAGIGCVRFDCNLWQIRRRQADGSVRWDYSKYDAIAAEARRRKISLLPILMGNAEDLRPICEHLEEYREFVIGLVTRYRDLYRTVEIWNEPNLRQFWHGQPDSAKYAELLKVAYESVKTANPSIVVVLGGLAGVPLDYIEGLYKAGGKRFFDVMNVHPYCHPNPPEGNLDVQLAGLRELMAKYDDGDKPIWITELGWPTHATALAGEGNLLSAGLKIADPGKSVWRVLYAATISDDALPDPAIAEGLAAILPSGSTVAVCGPKELVRRLEIGNADAVVFPFDESYPADALPAVVSFVRRGGTLVDFGGMPMCYAYRNLPDGRTKRCRRDPVRELRELRIGKEACFLHDHSAPESMQVFATEEALAAGVRQEPTGFKAQRYVTDEFLGPGDRMIPLLTGKNPNNGKTMTAACVYLLGEGNGKVVISCLIGKMRGTTTETNQGVYLARALGVALAEGVEKFFWYEFRAPEKDPYYSEHHFGLVHDNFAPKPAWGAYFNFIRQRPSGSVQLGTNWRCCEGKLLCPQWRRPDGRIGGMMWYPGVKRKSLVLHFDGRVMEFHNVWGLPLPVRKLENGGFRLDVGDSPVYFTGGRLNVEH